MTRAVRWSSALADRGGGSALRRPVGDSGGRGRRRGRLDTPTRAGRLRGCHAGARRRDSRGGRHPGVGRARCAGPRRCRGPCSTSRRTDLRRPRPQNSRPGHDGRSSGSSTVPVGGDPARGRAPAWVTGVRPLGVVEVERPTHGGQHVVRDVGCPALLQAGVVGDAPARVRSHLVAPLARHTAVVARNVAPRARDRARAAGDGRRGPRVSRTGSGQARPHGWLLRHGTDREGDGRPDRAGHGRFEGHRVSRWPRRGDSGRRLRSRRDRASDEVEAHLGQLDIVIASAATFVMKAVVDLTEEEFDRVFDLNAKGVFFVLQQAARRVHDGGRIVVRSTGGTATSRRKSATRTRPGDGRRPLSLRPHRPATGSPASSSAPAAESSRGQSRKPRRLRWD